MGFPVQVYVYDVTKGMARGMSQMLLGRQLDGVWHTGVLVYGCEYFFGGGGISYCSPGETILGPPDEVIHQGETEVPHDLFMEYLLELGGSSYGPDKYHLLDHNCNTFSNEVSIFLTGNPIPDKVTNLPGEVMETPFGQMIRPLIDNMMSNMNGGHHVTAASHTQTDTQNKPNTENNKKQDDDLD